MTGQVLDVDTGIPIPIFTIKTGDGSELAKADSDGKFSIAKLPADKSKLTVNAPGYAPVPLPLNQAQAQAIKLSPVILTGQLIDGDNQKPLANRLVLSTAGAVTTDADGNFTLARVDEKTKINVELVGYEKVSQAVDFSNLKDLKITLKPTSFDGSLADAASGKPIANALVKSGDVSTLTNTQGKFHFNDVAHTPTTEFTVRAAGYKLQNFKAGDLATGVKLEAFHFRGIYVPGIFAIEPNYDQVFADYYKMADKGEMNAIVLGVKDDDTGLLWYDSQVPLAKELGLIYDKNNLKKNQLINTKKLLEDAHKHGIYVVARYVVFRDPAIAAKKPEWAIKSKKTGKSWIDLSDLSWPNQFVPEVSDYNAELAKELAGLGFDEVQYDYIRFPSDGNLTDIQFKPGFDWNALQKDEKLRTDTIEAAVRKSWNILRTTNTFFSLDVFGYSLWREDDAGGIGQQYNNLSMMSDYICPMVYATHFSAGELGFPDPGAHPKEIIEQSGKIANKLDEKIHPLAKYRPWLEDFDKMWGANHYKTTPERVKVQIVAADTLGASGWTLWNANGRYLDPPLLQTAPARK